MSDNTTTIEPERRESRGLMHHDHEDWATMKEALRVSCERDLLKAQATLTDLDLGNFRVFQQRGVYVIKNRFEVFSDGRRVKVEWNSEKKDWVPV